MKVGKRIAVLLSGNGVYDGSEIMETSSLLMTLHKHNLLFQCYSLDKEMTHVINHNTGQEMKEKRNCLIESSRISRDFQNYDGLIIPGGFGVAKIFCSFAFDGENMTVDKDIENVIKNFYNQKKPIGASCIAPIILSKVLGKVKLTLGCKKDNFPYQDSIDVAQKFGSEMIEKDCGEICIDQENKIITTPAFMKDTKNWNEIYIGMDKMVEEIIKMFQ